MSNTKTRLTYADYLETSDDERYELLNAKLILSPSPKEIHQYILSILHLRIGTHARQHNLGKSTFLLSMSCCLTLTWCSQTSYSSPMSAPK